MNNPFSEAVFEMGWKLQAKIPFFGKQCEIAVLAEAYHEAEKAADAQVMAYDEFRENSEDMLKKVQKLLDYEHGEAVCDVRDCKEKEDKHRDYQEIH